ncbi:MAG: hypothetical protein H6741_14410 [Alphaproteobacteria bacterium]|nr:hypothetical protein [Alphaproteobacteria bacterium]
MRNVVLAMNLVLLAGCSGAGTSAPEKPPPSSNAVEAPAADPSEGSAPAPAAASQARFTATDKELTSILTGLPALSLPAGFPPSRELRDAAKKRALSKEQAARFVCSSNFFQCKLDEERQQFFALGQVPLSDKAIGVVFVGIGDMDSPVVLLTFSPSGECLGGHVVGGEFGDMEYGYDGELAADGRSLNVQRYVWVGGEEKEYADNLDFKLLDDGSLELVINP